MRFPFCCRPGLLSMPEPRKWAGAFVEYCNRAPDPEGLLGKPPLPRGCHAAATVHFKNKLMCAALRRCKHILEALEQQ